MRTLAMLSFTLFLLVLSDLTIVKSSLPFDIDYTFLCRVLKLKSSNCKNQIDGLTKEATAYQVQKIIEITYSYFNYSQIERLIKKFVEKQWGLTDFTNVIQNTSLKSTFVAPRSLPSWICDRLNSLPGNDNEESLHSLLQILDYAPYVWWQKLFDERFQARFNTYQEAGNIALHDEYKKDLETYQSCWKELESQIKPFGCHYKQVEVIIQFFKSKLPSKIEKYEEVRDIYKIICSGNEWVYLKSAKEVDGDKSAQLLTATLNTNLMKQERLEIVKYVLQHGKTAIRDSYDKGLLLGWTVVGLFTEIKQCIGVEDVANKLDMAKECIDANLKVINRLCFQINLKTQLYTKIMSTAVRLRFPKLFVLKYMSELCRTTFTFSSQESEGALIEFFFITYALHRCTACTDSALANATIRLILLRSVERKWHTIQINSFLEAMMLDNVPANQLESFFDVTSERNIEKVKTLLKLAKRVDHEDIWTEIKNRNIPSQTIHEIAELPDNDYANEAIAYYLTKVNSRCETSLITSLIEYNTARKHSMTDEEYNTIYGIISGRIMKHETVYHEVVLKEAATNEWAFDTLIEKLNDKTAKLSYM